MSSILPIRDYEPSKSLAPIIRTLEITIHLLILHTLNVNQGSGQPSREYDLPNLLKPQYSPDLASDSNHQYCTTGVLSDPFADC